ncbi:unnamed protein product [Arabis nemorensis]|uniref:Uncharacterized protein n=1 Tax=Arabis nemorensis TaxID=586526 RepID=A0A565BJY6_9BRAS|nr:unnamed protein product [Arabis nemorensis]
MFSNPPRLPSVLTPPKLYDTRSGLASRCLLQHPLSISVNLHPTGPAASINGLVDELGAKSLPSICGGALNGDSSLKQNQAITDHLEKSPQRVEPAGSLSRNCCHHRSWTTCLFVSPSIPPHSENEKYKIWAWPMLSVGPLSLARSFSKHFTPKSRADYYCVFNKVGFTMDIF